ncbi:MAG TPA: protein kinase [Candidatus Melainabacteria bacterium]|nr:protein kinase [Candidatus Melainabacteria bacterium]
MSARPIEFPRPKDYILERELGQGACGLTVVVYDPVIDERFVCKKYAPIYENLKEELFANFVKEIKLLYLLNHPNVVRVFNYYLYPERHLGYIFMEYVVGTDIDEYLKQHPESVNEVFRQAVEGFFHLEENRILHRDIRPLNLMVGENGVVKIIDFGFGKQTTREGDFDKSISLNWWCEPPQDFEDGIYDFTTEVYFVGKLFERIVSDRDIQHFKHAGLLRKMCARKPTDRTAAFADVRRELLSDRFLDINFEAWELKVYREFSSSLYAIASKVETNTKYYDVESVQSRLEDCLRKVMLEDVVPKNSLVLSCFVNGGYYFSTNAVFRVYTLREFVEFFRSCSREKKNIIISNLQTKLDAVPRYDQKSAFDDDIPF